MATAWPVLSSPEVHPHPGLWGPRMFHRANLKQPIDINRILAKSRLPTKLVRIYTLKSDLLNEEVILHETPAFRMNSETSALGFSWW